MRFAIPQTHVRPPPLSPAALLATLVMALPASAAAASAVSAPPPPSRPTALGALVQLPGTAGCVVDRSTPHRGCAPGRALRGPGPFLGSGAIVLDPKGANVYVASSRSNAIAIFRRDARSGRLTQSRGQAGCVAASGAGGCAPALGLRGPNAVAVSPDGRSVYATSLRTNSLAVFRRDPGTGALTQARDGGGCLSGAATTGCRAARALNGPDAVAVSPDGRNVYVGSFVGNAVAVFARDRSTGALTQPAGAAGCVGGAPADGCAPGLALGAPEGVAVSHDGATVYVAAATSNAVAVLTREPSTGALTQATDGTGCIVDQPLAGCTTGAQLGGANAVVVSPDDGTVHVTSLLSNSVTSFARAATTGVLAQNAGTSGCVVFVLAIGCSLGRAMSAPEGLAVAPDGTGVYVAAFTSSAIAGFTRDTTTGALLQMRRRQGCLLAAAPRDCTPARGLKGVSSVAISADGRQLYSVAFASNAVGVFQRVTGAVTRSRSPEGNGP